MAARNTCITDSGSIADGFGRHVVFQSLILFSYTYAHRSHSMREANKSRTKPTTKLNITNQDKKLATSFPTRPGLYPPLGLHRSCHAMNESFIFRIHLSTCAKHFVANVPGQVFCIQPGSVARRMATTILDSCWITPAYQCAEFDRGGAGGMATRTATATSIVPSLKRQTKKVWIPTRHFQPPRVLGALKQKRLCMGSFGFKGQARSHPGSRYNTGVSHAD